MLRPMLLGEEGLLLRGRPAGLGHLLRAGRGVERRDERQILVGHRPIGEPELPAARSGGGIS